MDADAVSPFLVFAARKIVAMHLCDDKTFDAVLLDH